MNLDSKHCRPTASTVCLSNDLSPAFGCEFDWSGLHRVMTNCRSEWYSGCLLFVQISIGFQM